MAGETGDTGRRGTARERLSGRRGNSCGWRGSSCGRCGNGCGRRGPATEGAGRGSGRGCGLAGAPKAAFFLLRSNELTGEIFLTCWAMDLRVFGKESLRARSKPACPREGEEGRPRASEETRQERVRGVA